MIDNFVAWAGDPRMTADLGTANLQLANLPYLIAVGTTSATKQSGGQFYPLLATAPSTTVGGIGLLGASAVCGLNFVRWSGTGLAVDTSNSCGSIYNYVTRTEGMNGVLFSSSGASGPRPTLSDITACGFDTMWVSNGAARVRAMRIQSHNRRTILWGNVNDTPKCQDVGSKAYLATNNPFANFTATSVAPSPTNSNVVRITFTLPSTNSGGLQVLWPGGAWSFWITAYDSDYSSNFKGKTVVGPGRWLVNFVSAAEPGTATPGSMTVEIAAWHTVDSNLNAQYKLDGTPQTTAVPLASDFNLPASAGSVTISILAGTGTMGEAFNFADVDTLVVDQCTAFAADVAYKFGATTATSTGGNNVVVQGSNCDISPGSGDPVPCGILGDGLTNGLKWFGGKVGPYRSGVVWRSTGGQATRPNSIDGCDIGASDFIGICMQHVSGELVWQKGSSKGSVNILDGITSLTIRDVIPRAGGTSGTPSTIAFYTAAGPPAVSAFGPAYQNTLVEGLIAWIGAPAISKPITVSDGLTATGYNLSGALQLVSRVNYVISAPANIPPHATVPTGVALTPVPLGEQITVFNLDPTNPLLIYPSTPSGQIDGTAYHAVSAGGKWMGELRSVSGAVSDWRTVSS